MVDYLSQLGYKPHHNTGNNYWYTSPLTTQRDRTPSFKINRKLNSWYDWSEGKNIGGNLVDFGILYHQCSVADFLEKLNGNKISIRQVPLEKEDKESQIQILTVKELQSLPLIKYLNQRKIPAHIYNDHCKEVTYQLKDKAYYSIGFKNDVGGYELRNEYSKLSSSPKGSTFIDNGAKELVTFEGFFNFLSYRYLEEKNHLPKPNYLILNSTSFFNKQLPLMITHEKVLLYLDNDKTGQKFSEQAIAIDAVKFEDKRPLYKDFKDLNDWLIHKGPTHKQAIRQTL
jgi:hypothetical protein